MREGGDKKPTHESERTVIEREIVEVESTLMELEREAAQIRANIADMEAAGEAGEGYKEEMTIQRAFNNQKQNTLRARLKELNEKLPHTLN